MPDFLLRASVHRLTVQSLPPRCSQLQFDLLLLGDRDEHLGKGRWWCLNGVDGVDGGSGIRESGVCTHKCNGRGKNKLCPVIFALGYGFTEYLHTGLLPGSASWPTDGIGWAALVSLVVLYGSAFSIWFVLMPRLDMARNASFMNIEPVAALVLAWLLLGQTLSAWQLAGVMVVLTGIVLLARLPKAQAA